MDKWLIVSHDAGGAELISSWIRALGPKRPGAFEFLLEGPAIGIFERKLGKLTVTRREELRALKCRFVLTGTSWSSDLERQAIRAARAQGIRVASYLDHWCNYPTRFESMPEPLLPDELWVGDSYALELAGKVFSETPINFEPNAFLEEMSREIHELESSRPRDVAKPRILFVSEPLSEPTEYGGERNPSAAYDEFRVLQSYLDHLRTMRIEPELIRVRPHPSEDLMKYQALLAPYRGTFSIESGNGRTLAEDCAWADWVVGCDTMAMAIAVVAGKKVFSCLPRDGKALTLPYPEIIKLFQA